jgi:hypothetical protein
MKRVAVASVVLVLAGLAGMARADDKDKPNPVGTWKWSTGTGDRARETTLKLRMDGDKLTGTVSAREGQETAVEDLTFKDGEISFKVTRERNGQKMTTKYTGKLSGDTIKGKVEGGRGRRGAAGGQAQTQSRDWEAKRVKEKTEK